MDPSLEFGTHHPPRPSDEFDSSPSTSEEISWQGVDVEAALMLLVSNPNIHEASGLDESQLSKRFSHKWSAVEALQDCKFHTVP